MDRSSSCTTCSDSRKSFTRVLSATMRRSPKPSAMPSGAMIRTSRKARFRIKRSRTETAIALACCVMVRTEFGRLLLGLAVASLCWADGFAQSPPAADSDQLSTTYLFAGLGGFIPMRDSYRLNYSTKLAGVPLEIQGGVMMPISPSLLVPVTVRDQRREANFIAGTSISVISVEPGVRLYLERQRDRDLRLFGMVEALLARATVQSTYD